MTKPLSEYQTFVFDCDGVVLNSNHIKTEAFYDVTKSFGKDLAQAFVEYHVTNGGVSRYIKFQYFITDILKQPLEQDVLNKLLEEYAHFVKKGLMSCDVAPGLEKLRELTPHANWLIVSGGDQSELREVFAKRDLDRMFNGGIYGSPDNKDTILAREQENKNIQSSALFLGDSKYDFAAAKKAGLDFLFLTNWSEVKNWEEWAIIHQINMLPSIADVTCVER